MSEQDEMLVWLKQNCFGHMEYKFWHQFFDDLDDCFAEIEPWNCARRSGWDWCGWDEEFTGQRIVWTIGDELDLIHPHMQFSGLRYLPLAWDAFPHLA